MSEETEIEHKHTVICGQECNLKQLWAFAGLLFLFLLSYMGVALMFAISISDSYVSTNLTITNDTLMCQNWKGPCISTLLKVHIFNYTNVNEYEAGIATKLHVEDIGPFVYEELPTKVNIKFHNNDTVSYQEKRIHKFRADLSKERKESDRVIVPDMVFMTLANSNVNFKDLMGILMATDITNITNLKPFLSLSAHEFLWGYDDNLYNMITKLESPEKEVPYGKTALLASRIRTTKDIVIVFFGKNDTNKIGKIDTFDGQTKLDHWLIDKWNKIQCSGGMLYPPDTIRQKNPVDVYFNDVCGSLPMVYEKEVKLLNGKVPAYKYVMPENVFNLPELNVDNQGFCDVRSGSCTPQGIFNCSLCVSDAPPLFVSFPHFYKADPDIKNAISGLKSGVENYESYMNVHPTLGFVISEVSRFQLNIQFKKWVGMSQLDMYDENMMLPVLWLEVRNETENIPDCAKEDIYTSTVTNPTTFETILKAGCLLTTLATLVAIVIVLLRKYTGRSRKLDMLKQSSATCPREEELIC